MTTAMRTEPLTNCPTSCRFHSRRAASVPVAPSRAARSFERNRRKESAAPHATRQLRGGGGGLFQGGGLSLDESRTLWKSVFHSLYRLHVKNVLHQNSGSSIRAEQPTRC